MWQTYDTDAGQADSYFPPYSVLYKKYAQLNVFTFL